MPLSEEQFSDLSTVLRLRPGSERHAAARAHFVDGLTVAEAARLTGADYRHTWLAVKRINEELDRMRRILT